ncbi:AraC family transcriptional regulator [Paucilactobacillus vaccinostercus DSM 20634]|uniref:AraC family transcriptional regulator n=2 Tax=Paucilactobacillus vaccinostercus TaxID=176291 RepID=A0A0R2A6L2_9LACO|nr:AraC family transcriptional regulator [Paucilactobacillus vaccinostercus DSM 20634]
MTYMSIEQLYIEALNVPGIEFKLFEKQPKITFKHGRILTSAYLSMFNELSLDSKVTVLRHTQNLFSFCMMKNDVGYLLGPEILTDVLSDQRLDPNQKTIYLPRLMSTISLKTKQCYKQLLVFANLLDIDLDESEINAAFTNSITSEQFNDKLVLVNFNDQGAHVSYVYEKALKAAVEMGQPSMVHDAFVGLVNSGRIGILSDEGDVRNVKNWGIICISVTLRAAIAAGMDYDQAYSLNDHYVRSLESFNSYSDVMTAIEEMLKDMAQRVAQLKFVHLSAPVRRTYQIIMNTPETKINATELSNQLGISPHYLSSLFKKEVGITIARFRILVKINRAIQILQSTNLSLAEIASILNFSDQSHLTREFEKFVGASPSRARRNPHLTDNWHLYNFIKVNVG